MTVAKLAPLELRIMEAVWSLGQCSVREIMEAFPKSQRSAYTTIQTTVYRLEAKKALRRAKKISNAHIFEAAVSQADIQSRFIDDVLRMFGGRADLLVAHMVESRKLTKKDIAEAEEILRTLDGSEEK